MFPFHYRLTERIEAVLTLEMLYSILIVLMFTNFAVESLVADVGGVHHLHMHDVGAAAPVCAMARNAGKPGLHHHPPKGRTALVRDRLSLLVRGGEIDAFSGGNEALGFPRRAGGGDLLLLCAGVAKLQASIRVPRILKTQIIFITSFEGGTCSFSFNIRAAGGLSGCTAWIVRNRRLRAAENPCISIVIKVILFVIRHVAPSTMRSFAYI